MIDQVSYTAIRHYLSGAPDKRTNKPPPITNLLRVRRDQPTKAEIEEQYQPFLTKPTMSGSAQNLEPSRKRKAMSRTVGRSVVPPPRRQRQYPVPIDIDDADLSVVEISSDEDEEETVRFVYGHGPRIKIPTSKILPFVQDRAIALFKRQFKTTRHKSQKAHLTKDVKLMPQIDKATFLTCYKDSWKGHLSTCVKAIEEEVRLLEDARERCLPWDSQTEIFDSQILEPKKVDLEQAEEDKAEMAALITLLQDN